MDFDDVTLLIDEVALVSHKCLVLFHRAKDVNDVDLTFETSFT